MSAASRGKPKSPEHCEKISKARKGWIYSEETLKKMSEGHKGAILSAEHRAKLSAAFKGENNHRWRGGVSFEPYCIKFNREFKERVLEFFGRKCAECGAPEDRRNT